MRKCITRGVKHRSVTTTSWTNDGRVRRNIRWWTQSRICVLLSRYFIADLTPNSSRHHLLLSRFPASPLHLVHLLHPAFLSFNRLHSHLPSKVLLLLTTSHYFFHFPFPYHYVFQFFSLFFPSLPPHPHLLIFLPTSTPLLPAHYLSSPPLPYPYFFFSTSSLSS